MAPDRGTPAWRDAAFVTAVWLATRAVLVAVAWAVLVAFPPELGDRFWQAFPDRLWIDGWARLDSAWYRELWDRGYHFPPEGQGTANFFPLYAWLSGILSLPLRRLPSLNDHQAFFVAGLAVSHAGAWLGLLGLHGLTRDRFGRGAADRAVWLLCLYPFSFFLGAVYTEGLFLGLAVWAFRLAGRERWGGACLLAGLAAVTRIPGFVVGVAVGLEYLRRHGPDPRSWGRDAAALLLAPVPLLLLLGYFAAALGDPFAFQKSQAIGWGREPSLRHVPDAVAALTSGRLDALATALVAWRLAVVAALAPAVWAVWHRLGAPLGVYTLLMLGMPVASGLEGLGRYGLAVFPVFAVAGAGLRSRAGTWAVGLAFLPFLLWFTAAFATWDGPLAGRFY